MVSTANQSRPIGSCRCNKCVRVHGWVCSPPGDALHWKVPRRLPPRGNLLRRLQLIHGGCKLLQSPSLVRGGLGCVDGSHLETHVLRQELNMLASQHSARTNLARAAVMLTESRSSKNEARACTCTQSGKGLAHKVGLTTSLMLAHLCWHAPLQSLQQRQGAAELCIHCSKQLGHVWVTRICAITSRGDSEKHTHVAPSVASSYRCCSKCLLGKCAQAEAANACEEQATYTWQQPHCTCVGSTPVNVSSSDQVSKPSK